MTPSPDRISVLIVAGFLGAGKTSFIRDLLPRLVNGPRAPYVILNDFLNAAIDTRTLQGLGAEIKELAARCVCCDDSNSLIDAILRVSVSIRPLIVIEANGTTNPMPHAHHHVAVHLVPPVMTEERLRHWLLDLPRDSFHNKIRVSPFKFSL